MKNQKKKSKMAQKTQSRKFTSKRARALITKIRARMAGYNDTQRSQLNDRLRHYLGIAGAALCHRR